MARNPKPIRKYYKKLYKSRKHTDHITVPLSDLWAFRHLRYPDIKKDQKIIMTARAMGKTQMILDMIKDGKGKLLAFHPEPDSGFETIFFDESTKFGVPYVPSPESTNN